MKNENSDESELMSRLIFILHYLNGKSEQLYHKATREVQMNESTGECFRTTVGVRQGCRLSPILFNIFSRTDLVKRSGRMCWKL